MTDAKRALLAELDEVWKDCSEPDWDGYDAYPVTADARNQAERFLNALPADCHAPSLGAEPLGHLSLEWHRDRYWTLSVSVTPEGALHYAALLGRDRACGTIPNFDEVPQAILELIERVYAGSSGSSHDSQ